MRTLLADGSIPRQNGGVSSQLANAAQYLTEAVSAAKTCLVFSKPVQRGDVLRVYAYLGDQPVYEDVEVLNVYEDGRIASVVRAVDYTSALNLPAGSYYRLVSSADDPPIC